MDVIDVYSKFAFSFPLKNKSADAVVNVLTKLFYYEGACQILQSDNGKEFVNSKMKELLDKFHIKHVRGRPRHPQSQGQIERFNQTLVRSLAKALDSKPKNWCLILDEIVFQYNTGWHRAINKTPMEIFRGRTGTNSQIGVLSRKNELKKDVVETLVDISDSQLVDLDILKYAQVDTGDIEEENQMQEVLTVDQKEEAAFEAYRERYIQKMIENADVHHPGPTVFSPGDEVILGKDFDANPNTRKEKFEQFFEGGVWIVEKRVGAEFYEISIGNHKLTVNRNRLRKNTEYIRIN